MGYLGLDETQVKEDNLFQRLFWPGDHAGETDALGKQGFWVCWIVAVLSAIVLSLQGHEIIGILQMTFFAMGGIGVREHNVAAASLVAAGYWGNQASALFLGQFPGIFAIAAGVLLIANIRGTYIANRWKERGDPEAFPERAHATWKERFVDRMPATVWPQIKIPFFCIAGIYMAMVVLGFVMLAVKARI